MKVKEREMEREVWQKTSENTQQPVANLINANSLGTTLINAGLLFKLYNTTYKNCVKTTKINKKNILLVKPFDKQRTIVRS